MVIKVNFYQPRRRQLFYASRASDRPFRTDETRLYMRGLASTNMKHLYVYQEAFQNAILSVGSWYEMQTSYREKGQYILPQQVLFLQTVFTQILPETMQYCCPLWYNLHLQAHFYWSPFLYPDKIFLPTIACRWKLIFRNDSWMNRPTKMPFFDSDYWYCWALTSKNVSANCEKNTMEGYRGKRPCLC